MLLAKIQLASPLTERLPELSGRALGAGGTHRGNFAFGPILLAFLFFRVGSHFSGNSQSQSTRFVRLLHGTLRVNAAARIRNLPADGTRSFDRLWHFRDEFNGAHNAPNSELG